MTSTTTVLRMVFFLTLLLSSVTQAQTNSVRGYVRSDKINSVVYRGLRDGKIYELWLAPGGNWTLGGPSNLAGAPFATSGPAPYVRVEYSGQLSYNSILYVGLSGDVIELYLRPGDGVWQWGNLTGISGAPAASNLDPAAYTRYDVGGNPIWSVMYQAQSNAHIYEIYGSLYGTTWYEQDITQLSNSPTATASPAPFFYTLGRQDITYRRPGGHLYYLWKVWNGSWQTVDLSASPVNAPIASSDAPAALKRPDNYGSVTYRGSDSHIYEAYTYSYYSAGGAWSIGDLTAITGAPLGTSGTCSYNRANNTYAVLYNSNGHIIELHLAASGWEKHDLSTLTNAPTAASKPSAYVRSDGVDAVVYRGTDGHIYELWSRGGNAWNVGDLTAIAGL